MTNKIYINENNLPMENTININPTIKRNPMTNTQNLWKYNNEYQVKKELLSYQYLLFRILN
jgi:hypothetical protein